MITILDVDPIIKEEEKEADLKVKKSWHWGNTGYLQKRTVLFCKMFINQYMDNSGVLNSISLLDKLEKYENELKYDSDDEYGYAHATVSEILKKMKGIIQIKKISIPNKMSFFNKLIVRIKLYFLIKKYSEFK